ncbi:Uncharacterised protein [Yersinia intermedia]|nr:Uncharacterised protein [Yersinia intermedia]
MASTSVFIVEMKEPITVISLIIYHLIKYYFPLSSNRLTR